MEENQVMMKLGGVKVEKSIKYLGLMIDDEKDIFKTQKEKIGKEF